MKDKTSVITEDIPMAGKLTSDQTDPTVGGKVHTMAQVTDGGQSREVAASTNAGGNPIVPGNFHEFNGSQAKMYDTYETRLAKVGSFLGNKAPIVS